MARSVTPGFGKAPPFDLPIPLTVLLHVHAWAPCRSDWNARPRGSGACSGLGHPVRDDYSTRSIRFRTVVVFRDAGASPVPQADDGDSAGPLPCDSRGRIALARSTSVNPVPPAIRRAGDPGRRCRCCDRDAPRRPAVRPAGRLCGTCCCTTPECRLPWPGFPWSRPN